MTVNVENMQKLVAAMRSSEYQQGYGSYVRVLPDGTTAYCPLGLARKIAGSTGWGEIDDFFGVAIPSITLEHPAYGSKSLIILNDDFKTPFASLADLLEKKFPEIKVAEPEPEVEVVKNSETRELVFAAIKAMNDLVMHVHQHPIRTQMPSRDLEQVRWLDDEINQLAERLGR